MSESSLLLRRSILSSDISQVVARKDGNLTESLRSNVMNC